MPVSLRTLSLLAAMLAGVAFPALVMAQDDPADALVYPGYLQRGTCAEPGDPLAALAETATGPDDPDGPGVSSGDGVETPVNPTAAALPATVSVTEVDASLTDLLDDELIVRIVAGEDDPERDVACGVVSGEPDEDGNVYVGLTATNGSNVWGVAWLRAEDDVTTVTIFLIPITPADDAAPSDQPAD